MREKKEMGSENEKRKRNGRGNKWIEYYY